MVLRAWRASARAHAALFPTCANGVCARAHTALVQVGMRAHACPFRGPVPNGSRPGSGLRLQ